MPERHKGPSRAAILRSFQLLSSEHLILQMNELVTAKRRNLPVLLSSWQCRPSHSVPFEMILGPKLIMHGVYLHSAQVTGAEVLQMVEETGVKARMGQRVEWICLVVGNETTSY